MNKFNENINSLESELKSRQNELDRTKAENNLFAKEQRRIIEDLTDKLDRVRRELRDCEKDRDYEKQQNEEYREKTTKQISDLTKQVRELETSLE